MIYTTTKAAKICGVCPTTIVRACEQGDLEYFKVPGSKHRRITHQALARFMRKHRIPTTPKPDPSWWPDIESAINEKIAELEQRITDLTNRNYPADYSKIRLDGKSRVDEQ
jgi:excisionase family DNA binding protein